VGDGLVCVSTIFHPGAFSDSSPPDLIFCSSDSILFFVQSHVLTCLSKNQFNNLVASPLGPGSRVLGVPEPSCVFNVVLHAIYGARHAPYAPPLEVLSAGLQALVKYGVALERCTAPSHPLFACLQAAAPGSPLEVYALAATHGLHALAVAASAHLLSFPLASLTDDMADRIGPVYLKRLFLLHSTLEAAFKEMLHAPPVAHPPVPACRLAEQQQLTKAWATASAYLAWDARPGASHSRNPFPVLRKKCRQISRPSRSRWCSRRSRASCRANCARNHWATVSRTSSGIGPK
jgi:hypothetical protein